MDEAKYTHGLKELLDHTIYIAKNSFSDVSIKQDELIKICCSPLLLKAMNKAHAINVMVAENLLEESEIILRVLVEVSFIVKSIELNPDFAMKYGKSSYAQKLRSLKILKNGIDQDIPNLEISESYQKKLQEQIEYFKNKIKEENFKEIKIYEYAKEAGLLAIYYNVYSQLCSSVHSGPEDIDSYFTTAENGFISAISRPKKNNQDVILFTAIEAMLRILKSLCTVFSVTSEKLNKAEELYHGVEAILRENVNPNQYFK